MKKIILVTTLLILTIFLNSCGKKPFTEKVPELNSALVYIYVAQDSYESDSIGSSCYKVVLDEEYTKSCIHVGEYINFNLKPKNIDITVIRANIEKQVLNLNLKVAKIYYLRVESFSEDFAKFSVVEVSREKALSEIKDATLVLAYNIEEENKAIVSSSKTNNFSKTDELQKAHKLKEQGILSEDEFNKLKAEILAK